MIRDMTYKRIMKNTVGNLLEYFWRQNRLKISAFISPPCFNVSTVLHFVSKFEFRQIKILYEVKLRRYYGSELTLYL